MNLIGGDGGWFLEEFAGETGVNMIIAAHTNFSMNTIFNMI